jgi:branched-subunit amino acid aminotransferase/4-amino-4-deoxychorismate lyase
MKKMVVLNGKLLSLEKARISPMDHGFLYGDGIYETLRTHNGKIFDFSAHFSRLQSSAKLLDIPLLYSEKELLEICEKLAETQCTEPKKEYRIRITLTRGENEYQFLGSKSPTLLITISPLKDYTKERKGISLTSLQIERTLPEAKTVSMLVNTLAKQKCARENTFECALIDHEGFVTEGAVSNILYAKNGTLFFTPEGHTLAGTAQLRVLETAKNLGIKTQEKRFAITDLQNADEVFITNSLFDILPVKEVEKERISRCNGEIYDRIFTNLSL